MNFDIKILQCPLTGEDLHLIISNSEYYSFADNGAL